MGTPREEPAMRSYCSHTATVSVGSHRAACGQGLQSAVHCRFLSMIPSGSGHRAAGGPPRSDRWDGESGVPQGSHKNSANQKKRREEAKTSFAITCHVKTSTQERASPRPPPAPWSAAFEPWTQSFLLIVVGTRGWVAPSAQWSMKHSGHARESASWHQTVPSRSSSLGASRLYAGGLFWSFAPGLRSISAAIMSSPTPVMPLYSPISCPSHPRWVASFARSPYGQPVRQDWGPPFRDRPDTLPPHRRAHPGERGGRSRGGRREDSSCGRHHGADRLRNCGAPVVRWCVRTVVRRLTGTIG
jgi:hypothetical protein